MFSSVEEKSSACLCICTYIYICTEYTLPIILAGHISINQQQKIITRFMQRHLIYIYIYIYLSTKYTQSIYIFMYVYIFLLIKNFRTWKSFKAYVPVYTYMYIYISICIYKYKARCYTYMPYDLPINPTRK